jgi:hypothetical protein
MISITEKFGHIVWLTCEYLTGVPYLDCLPQQLSFGETARGRCGRGMATINLDNDVIDICFYFEDERDAVEFKLRFG